MYLEGSLSGSPESYPLIIHKIEGFERRSITIKDENELIELIDKELADPFNEKKKIGEIFMEMGLQNTAQLTDLRTAQILKEFLFYQKSPHSAPYNNEIWYESVITLNPLFTTRIF